MIRHKMVAPCPTWADCFSIEIEQRNWFDREKSSCCPDATSDSRRENGTIERRYGGGKTRSRCEAIDRWSKIDDGFDKTRRDDGWKKRSDGEGKEMRASREGGTRQRKEVPRRNGTVGSGQNVL